VVDELAAIPLSLWAAQKEHTKLSTNLLGSEQVASEAGPSHYFPGGSMRVC
jgi:hypothetical protein